MTQSNTSAGGSGAIEGTGVHRPPDDREEVYFEGSPSLRGEAGTMVLCGVIDLVLLGLAIGIACLIATPLAWLVAIPTYMLIGALVVLYPVISIRLRRFKITNYRIDVEQGLLSKSIDTLELWHVEDITFHQSLWDRLLGVGTLTVLSHDDTMPRLVMRGLPDPRKLFDVLKQRVISVKRQRGVLKVDTGN